MYISEGNRKLHDRFLIWNLPSGVTCPGSTPLCRRWCYAKKAERLHRGVLACRHRNLAASRRSDFPLNLARAIEHKLARKPNRLFRIHEAGDFYSQAYLDTWFTVAALFPAVRFLAYTASFHLDFSRKPPNLQIIWSVWADTNPHRVPSGPRSFVGYSRSLDPERFDRAFLCPGKCADCLYCWFADDLGDVRFRLH